MKRIISLVVIGLLCVTGSVQSAEQGWKAGVARAMITPQTPVWLAGYGTKRAPDGKLHDLWMKAIAFESADGRRAVLITSDFQGVPKSMSDPVFALLQEKHGLSRAQVMFTFSHNHCSPRLGDDLVDYYPEEPGQVEIVNAYTGKMVEKTVALVGEALKNLAPATLKTGSGRAGFAVNRRNNPEPNVASMIAAGEPLKGPVDHTVPVLAVSRPGGELLALLFGYACHPTTLSFMTYCGDYPGFAQAALEQSHPGASAMFVNTCGGDQNPLPRRSVELCERYGQMLASAVEETLLKPMEPVEPQLQLAFEMIELKYLAVATEHELQEAANGTSVIKARWAKRMLAQKRTGKAFDAGYPYPLHAWRLGRKTLFIGMGAETVVDYALRFKREFGPQTWVMGYTDYMIAYIPSRRVWEEGGYEGGSNLFEYGRPAFRWAGDVEDRIAAGVHRLVRQVGLKIKTGQDAH